MRDSLSTRRKVLDAAEDAYATIGVEGLTLRLVTERALVNLASINYHFGTKRALAEEMLRRRLDPLHRDRLALLEAAEQAFGPELRVAHVVTAILLPGIGRMLASESRTHLAAFLTRCAADPTPLIRDAMTLQFQAYGERFDAAFVRCMHGIPPTHVLWRVRLLFNAVPGTVMNPNTIVLLQNLLAQPTLTLADVVTQFVGVIDCKDGEASDKEALREQVMAMERVMSSMPVYRQWNLSLEHPLGSFGSSTAQQVG
ncbi:TetR/AcrR family transcriptional regulator [Robbsia sp. Bb-Pol-6]|uniref:TetR/AcrR family transcriptional regulator n=1 Tax=Robbsia betulipollinis TaxID=2981849 RepID=A0ABT3ZGT4_9BURK|nr:TetR/AcrR family transcriptional regulator [Robbsia betulipollinis]MCY0385735.1 TetR/AcrR family transcriptional regulator [Robbsia betulipollinis]